MFRILVTNDDGIYSEGIKIIIDMDFENYVYVYSDPENHKPFYVGRGVNQRVFDHLRENNKESEKIKNCE